MTPAEFFSELARFAEKDPGMFEKYIVIWEPCAGHDTEFDLAATEGMTLAVANTMLDLAKMDLLSGLYDA